MPIKENKRLWLQQLLPANHRIIAILIFHATTALRIITIPHLIMAHTQMFSKMTKQFLWLIISSTVIVKFMCPLAACHIGIRAFELKS